MINLFGSVKDGHGNIVLAGGPFNEIPSSHLALLSCPVGLKVKRKKLQKRPSTTEDATKRKLIDDIIQSMNKRLGSSTKIDKLISSIQEEEGKKAALSNFPDGQVP